MILIQKNNALWLRNLQAPCSNEDVSKYYLWWSRVKETHYYCKERVLGPPGSSGLRITTRLTNLAGFNGLLHDP
jgi:hypothetical protein